ncbi:leucyl aminopeptidase [Flagelloscypha sp. PMI_526]|nr:leucyl aminopeptidase [Flagelloscypha sp. PMI_526]
MASTDTQHRLPTDVKATHYDVTVKTDLKAQIFEGLAKIYLDVVKDTSQVVFNSSELELGKAEITSNGSSLEQTDLAADKEKERIALKLASNLKAGSTAILKVPFKGSLTSAMTGYYKSRWENEGKEDFYALTQFAATAARRAFPCWDEPALKATFAITMISRGETVSLSNMPSISEAPLQPGAYDNDIASIVDALPKDEKWKITKFDTTPKMSTYIVAFANGPFEHIERHITLPLSGKQIPLRIYGTKDLIHQTEFALEVKAKVIPLYEKVFDVAFPLPKLDTLVAHDFDAGAMENWGLIIGRKQAFCLDPNSLDLSMKMWVAAVQSHECAHMWFGNITTMAWWSTLWLNESFATLMGEVIIPDKIFPEWKVNSAFINVHLSKGLGLDGKLSSHPIEVKVKDANEVNQIFDALSYSKGGSVLRMLANYVTEEKFLAGVSLYLKANLYGNTETKDLWDGISKATNIDIAELMDNWISKTGFPVLTVTESSDSITVRQDRFLDTGKLEDKDNQTIWNVPLAIASTGEDGQTTVDRSAVLRKREQTFKINTTKPYKLNSGTSGVYRVLYSPERLQALGTEAAKPKSVFTLDDRMGLVQDAMALALAGYAKFSAALTLVDLFRHEKEYLVWASIASGLAEIPSIWWEYPEILDQFNAFRRSLYVPLVEKLGFEYEMDEHPDVTMLRTLAISNAARAGDESVNAHLKSNFDHFAKTGDDSKIVNDLLAITFLQAVKLGGKDEYDAVFNVLANPKTPTAASAAMKAIGSAQDEKLMEQTYDYIFHKSRDQDVLYLFVGLEANNKFRRKSVEMFEANYDHMYKRLEGNVSLSRLIEYIYRSVTTEEDTRKMVAFFKDKDRSKISMMYEQTLDGHKAARGSIERSTDDVKSWLDNWSSKL